MFILCLVMHIMMFYVFRPMP